MKNIQSLTVPFKKYFFVFIILLVLAFAVSGGFAFFSQNQSSKSHTEVHSLEITQQPTKKLKKNKPLAYIPTPAKKSASDKNILGIKNTINSPFPNPTIKENKERNDNATTMQSNSLSPTSQTTNDSQPTTQLITTPTPTSSPTIVKTNITIEIKTPDSSTSFSMEIKDGMNLCDVLQKAKDDGKINSVTFDDTYLSSLHSKYVYEINGYKNSWTFTVNETSPLGCSLSNPKPNDTIIWKFG